MRERETSTSKDDILSRLCSVKNSSKRCGTMNNYTGEDCSCTPVYRSSYCWNHLLHHGSNATREYVKTIISELEVRGKIENANFDGVDFSSYTLNDAFFINCTFVNAKFNECKAERMRFKKCDLRGTQFVKAQLVDSQFTSHCKIAKANFSFADLSSCIFRDSYLGDVSSYFLNLAKGGIVKCELTNLHFVKSQLDNAFFIDSVFKKVSFEDATGESVCFKGTTFKEAEFINVDFPRVSFKNANLRKAKLICAKMPEAKFTGANLRGVRIDGSDFFKAEFEGANLAEACVESTNLTEATFSEKALIKVKLYGSTLTRVDVLKCGLKYTDLKRVHGELVFPKKPMVASKTSHACQNSKTCLCKTGLVELAETGMWSGYESYLALFIGVILSCISSLMNFAPPVPVFWSGFIGFLLVFCFLPEKLKVFRHQRTNLRKLVDILGNKID